MMSLETDKIQPQSPGQNARETAYRPARVLMQDFLGASDELILPTVEVPVIDMQNKVLREK